tara:strand:- start:1498 stop:1749 length:252 start_codon:yes stop_codon:yes gene_type:complete
MPDFIRVNQGFSVEVPDNPSELQLKQSQVKAERNSKLAETDVYMVSDFPITTEQKTAWKTYRQELRDIDFSDPDNIKWPSKPE